MKLLDVSVHRHHKDWLGTEEKEKAVEGAGNHLKVLTRWMGLWSGEQRQTSWLR